MFEKECDYQNGKYIAKFGEITVEVDESLIYEDVTILFPVQGRLCKQEDNYYRIEPDKEYMTYCYEKEGGLGGECKLYVMNPSSCITSFQFDNYAFTEKERGIVASVEGKYPLRLEWHMDGILRDGEYPFGATIIYPDGAIEQLFYTDHTEEDLEIAQSKDL